MDLVLSITPVRGNRNMTTKSKLNRKKPSVKEQTSAVMNELMNGMKEWLDTYTIECNKRLGEIERGVNKVYSILGHREDDATAKPEQLPTKKKSKRKRADKKVFTVCFLDTKHDNSNGVNFFVSVKQQPTNYLSECLEGTDTPHEEYEEDAVLKAFVVTITDLGDWDFQDMEDGYEEIEAVYGLVLDAIWRKKEQDLEDSICIAAWKGSYYTIHRF